MAEWVMVQKSAAGQRCIHMETLTLQKVVEFAGGRLLAGGEACPVPAISTDTRTLRSGEMFLALRGDHFDGHDHVRAAAAAGAMGAIVDRSFAAGNLPPDFALVEVDNPLAAYQNIAARYKQSLPLKVVGITGSNGKTSTKDFAAAVLSRRFRVLKTEGNLNNHIGLPKMLLRADLSHEVAVLEMGMNHPGEIEPLARMASPDVAIITNIGRAHLEFMGSREAIAQEKGMLAEAIGPAGTVILNGADEFTPSIARRTSARVVTVDSENATLHVKGIVQDLSGSRFTIVTDTEQSDAHIPVTGRHMIVNALLAVAAGMALGIPLSECAAALGDVELTKGRLEKKSLHGRWILDDSYNANPDSMSAALETLTSLAVGGRRIAVLGKMGELGDAAEDGYRAVGELAAAKGIDCIVTVGSEARVIGSTAQIAGATETIFAADTDQAARWLAEFSREGDLILVKGSRSAGMDRVLATLASLLQKSPVSADKNTSALTNAR